MEPSLDVIRFQLEQLTVGTYGIPWERSLGQVICLLQPALRGASISYRHAWIRTAPARIGWRGAGMERFRHLVRSTRGLTGREHWRGARG
jgi:hypothetical protein